MRNPTLAKFQIGKNGVNEGVVESLTMALKNHKQVRVSVLKSFCRNRDELNSVVADLLEKLPFRLKARVIGYTIVLIKLGNK